MIRLLCLIYFNKSFIEKKNGHRYVILTTTINSLTKNQRTIHGTMFLRLRPNTFARISVLLVSLGWLPIVNFQHCKDMFIFIVVQYLKMVILKHSLYQKIGIVLITSYEF